MTGFVLWRMWGSSGRWELVTLRATIAECVLEIGDTPGAVFLIVAEGETPPPIVRRRRFKHAQVRGNITRDELSRGFGNVAEIDD